MGWVSIKRACGLGTMDERAEVESDEYRSAAEVTRRNETEGKRGTARFTRDVYRSTITGVFYRAKREGVLFERSERISCAPRADYPSSEAREYL